MAEEVNISKELVRKVKALMEYQGIQPDDIQGIEKLIADVKADHQLTTFDLFDETLYEFTFSYEDSYELHALINFIYLVADQTANITQPNQTSMTMSLKKIDAAYINAIYSAYKNAAQYNSQEANTKVEILVSSISFNVHPLPIDVEKHILHCMGMLTPFEYLSNSIKWGHHV